MAFNNQVNGAQTLAVNTGGTTFGRLVGNTTALNGGTVTPTGTQTYNDVVTLGANTTLTSTTPTFGSTVAGGGFDLTLTTGANTMATAPVTVIGGPIALTAANSVNQNANLTAGGANAGTVTTTDGPITMAVAATTTSGTGAISYTAGTDVTLGSLGTGGAVNVIATEALSSARQDRVPMCQPARPQHYRPSTAAAAHKQRR